MFELLLDMSAPLARSRLLRADGWSMIKEDRRWVLQNEEHELDAQ